MKKLSSLLAIMFFGLALVSCTEKENNNSQSGDSTLTMAKLDLTYQVSLDANSVNAITTGYDVSLEYYGADGQKVVANPCPLTANSLSWELSVTQTSFPSRYGAAIIFTPKSGLPEDAEFPINGSIKGKATATFTNGKTRQIEPAIESRYFIGEPSNGRTFQISALKEVAKDGTTKPLIWK